MKTSDGSFHYCYNAQTVVDEGSQVILSTALVASGADSPELPGALAGLADSLAAAGIEGLPRTLLADAGYFSASNGLSRSLCKWFLAVCFFRCPRAGARGR